MKPKGFRKAMKGDIPCAKCKYHRDPLYFRAHGYCALLYNLPSVGKFGTCDQAAKKVERRETQDKAL